MRSRIVPLFIPLLAAMASACASSSGEDIGSSSSASQTDTNRVPGPICLDAIPAPPSVDVDRELMIRDVRVVEDPVRSAYPSPFSRVSRSSVTGAWSFGRLVERMAGEQDPSAFVLAWLAHWERSVTVNGQVIPARPAITSFLIDPWVTASGCTTRKGCQLRFDKAPFRLLSIVNRMDLRHAPTGYAGGNAGEGRFVFGVLDSAGNATSFTVIFEYELPAQTFADVRGWANAWHELGSFEPGSDAYATRLQAITDRFTGKNAIPSKPNGSALNQLRTNEIQIGSPWQLREFHLSGKTGFLKQGTTAQTPQNSVAPSLVSQFINDNEAAVVAQTHTVPATLLGGSSEASGFVWNPPAVRNPEARFGFAVNTCNGCHLDETSTGFTHVSPRSACTPGNCEPAGLSGFLTGVTVTDPVNPNLSHTFNDLARRADDLGALLVVRPSNPCCFGTIDVQRVCPDSAVAARQAENDEADRALWNAGSHRVH
jgi:hypothetical protein